MIRYSLHGNNFGLKFSLRANYPETLSDFISDCERAGIELTFKSEIIDKYFRGIDKVK